MPIALRTNFDATTVRAAVRKSKDGAQARRLLVLAAIYEGSSRSEAARIGGVTLRHAPKAVSVLARLGSAALAPWIRRV